MNLHSKPPSWLDLESVIPLEKPKRRSNIKEDERRSAEEITNLSGDTLRRRHRDKIIKLSDRRRGMKLRVALAIANGE